MWNLLYHYNNIYTNLHKYLKGKKKNSNRLLKEKKKKKNPVVTVATMPLDTVITVQNLGKKKSGSRNQSPIATVL